MTETKLTAIERLMEEIDRLDEADEDFNIYAIGAGDLIVTTNVADHRLAADCIAFVREFAALDIEDGVYPTSIYDLAIRVEEASE